MDEKVANTENKKEIVSLSGRLGADAKQGTSRTDQKPVLVFSVADNSDGENVKWTNVQMDKDLFKQELKKGDAVELKGYMESFTTDKGPKQEFIATELVSYKQKQAAAQQETIKGNLGQDPIFANDNKERAYFSLAIKQEGKTEPVWQNIKVWEKDFEKAKVHELKKGDTVELTGHYKEYESKGEIKNEFVVSESKILKHAQKQDEKVATGVSENSQTEKQAETKAVTQDQAEKKSNNRGMKM